MSSSAPPSSVAIEPGTRLDRYELLCLLAHGGMANVWLARVQGKGGFSKLLAIKTILQHEADNQTFREMFLDEAKIASRIDHPSVVQIVDVGELAGIPFLVMDLIEGEPLHKLARAVEKAEEKIPLGVALRIVADACQGLHAAHELKDEKGMPLGVVHRDISPQNILVTTAGVSKVIDFGIAKARDRSARQTTTGTLKGKISYMPREQALGKDVDRRADTWALGAVLYFLLKGDPPYRGDTQLATLQLAMNAAPVPPLPEGIPLAVRTLVTRALAQPIDRRFQSAAEMGAAIEKVMQTLKVATPHAEVAAFIGRVMKEKLDARKALIANAIDEAEKREKAKEQLTIPIELEIGDTEFMKRSAAAAAAAVAMPSPDASSYGSRPGVDGTGPGTGPGTSSGATDGGEGPSIGTFGAATVEPFAPRRNAMAIATMVLAGLSIVGAAAIGALLYTTRIEPPKQMANTAGPLENAPPPPVPATATLAAAQVTAETSSRAIADAAPPAKDSGPSAAKPPAATPKAASKAAAPRTAPATKAHTSPASATPAKRRDDEAGF